MTRRTRKARAANGQGSVYLQKDGLWAAAVTVNGRRSISRAKTRDEAERLRLGLLRKREEGSLIVGPDPTLALYLDRWLEARREAIKPWTYRGYRTQITHINAVLGEVKLRALTSEHVVVLIRRRMEDGASAKHVRLAHQCLRTALGDPLRERRVSVNVASLELLPRGVLPIVRRHAINPYTELEARQLVEAAKGDRMEALWVLALKSGLRQGELLGLTWEDVDFDHRTVSVNKSLQRKDGRFMFETTKSPKSRRSVRLSAEVVGCFRVIASGRRPCRHSGISSSPRGRGARWPRGTSSVPSSGSSPGRGCARSVFTTCGTRTPRCSWWPACRRRWCKSGSGAAPTT